MDRGREIERGRREVQREREDRKERKMKERERYVDPCRPKNDSTIVIRTHHGETDTPLGGDKNIM